MAGMTLSSLASTTMVLARRFTSALSTPAVCRVTFSTLAEQAAQVIPVTWNRIFIVSCPFQKVNSHVEIPVDFFLFLC